MLPPLLEKKAIIMQPNNFVAKHYPGGNLSRTQQFSLTHAAVWRCALHAAACLLHSTLHTTHFYSTCPVAHTLILGANALLANGRDASLPLLTAVD